jgi:hypothetical protein
MRSAWSEADRAAREILLAHHVRRDMQLKIFVAQEF